MGRFPRSARLLVPSDFQGVFERRSLQRGRLLTLHYRPRSESPVPQDPNDAPRPARLGVVVPKKLLRSAVHRNLVKRIVREAFRERADNLASLDIVVRLTSKPKRPDRGPGVSIDRKALGEEVRSLIDRLPSRPSTVRSAPNEPRS